MKEKRTSGLLTIIMAILLLGFLAFTHVVSGLVTFTGYAAGFTGFMDVIKRNLTILFVPDFGVREQMIGFIIAVSVLALALIFAIVWTIRLLVYKRKSCNLFSPLLFLVSVMIGVVLVSSHAHIEEAFDVKVAEVAVAYWFVLGVLVVALGLHLLVVGLATSGARKEESMLKEELGEEPAPEEKVEEEAKVEEEKVEEKAKVDLDDKELDALIRKLANEEIDKREPRVVEKVVEKAPAAEPKVEVKPAPAPVPVPVPAPVKEKKPAPERVPFPQRMQMVEDPVKDDYNTIKNYLLSYGLNSRLSNVGDSFRSGRVLYARLTNSGNSGLKLYLPINLDDYKDSKIPLKSAEGVKQYEDVPVFIYVRSDLSMKRALQLIDDVMAKNGIERKFEPEKADHIKDLK
ncbi:MAG: hypothetical protein RBS24_05130 [Bacilli bacterium]|nr:hypothetical protein [Bacilli bacterium]